MTQLSFYTTIDEFWGYVSQKLFDNAFDPDIVLIDVYYDGELIPYFLADFFATTTPYYTYADNANEVYQQNYAIPAVYQLPGFFCFNQGWAEAFIRRAIAGRSTGVSALVAVDGGRYMYPGSPGLNSEGRTPATRHEISREFGYSIINMLQKARLTALSGSELTFIQQRYTDSQTIIDDWSGNIGAPPASQTASYFRPFMGSITMHALINFYEDIATAPQKSAIISSAIQLGEYAMATCWSQPDLAFNYTDRDVGNPDDLIPQPTLNMLIAPWFAWLWSVTGDAAWKTRAEDIIDGGEPIYVGPFWASGAFLGGRNAAGVLGKEVNQQFVWGTKAWDYLGVSPPTPPTPTPPVGGSSYPGGQGSKSYIIG